MSFATIKLTNRFPFLFNDILVITKPILHDQDSLTDLSTLMVLDTRFIVESFIQPKNIRVEANRDDNRLKPICPVHSSTHFWCIWKSAIRPLRLDTN